MYVYRYCIHKVGDISQYIIGLQGRKTRNCGDTTLIKVIIKNALNMSHGNMFKDSGHTYTSNEHHPYNMRNKKPSGQFILIFRFPCLNTIHVQKINMIKMG